MCNIPVQYYVLNIRPTRIPEYVYKLTLSHIYLYTSVLFYYYHFYIFKRVKTPFNTIQNFSK